ncbi:hypothetical protein MAR_014156 [Mya arenaria]|uniref:Uncharacterized protein n=1 Tax=Mya arenaria TaxID=6604 RepID=A0ABY7G553_MYAAR|nr:hypothetical protein MAR_014156 [Mya arenaria]
MGKLANTSNLLPHINSCHSEVATNTATTSKQPKLCFEKPKPKTIAASRQADLDDAVKKLIIG